MSKHEGLELDRQISKAVEADMQQYFIDALTPDRGYDAPPIHNTRELILKLLAEQGERKLAKP